MSFPLITGGHAATSTAPAVIKELPQTYAAEKSSTSMQSNQINVFQYNSKEPAPMGIADYGIGYNNESYEYNTTSFLGIANINYLCTYNNSLSNASKFMSFQLNINLVFYEGDTEYVYWVQDVAFLNTSSGNHLIYFIDNVWNSSAPNANMHNSTISGNGTVGNSSGTYFYYDYASSSLPGNCIDLQYPSTIEFKIVSAITSNDQPEVIFMYNDGHGWVTYDNVVFKFVNDLTSDCGFVVNGNNYNPHGDYYDAALILGGPGDGSQTNDISSNIQLQLEYWNGHNYQEILNAYNYGSDTAEGICNVSDSAAYYTYNGTLFSEVTNGTGSLGQIYNQYDIGIINLTSNLKSGSLVVNGTSYNFVNCDVNITLAPGYYDLQLYNSEGVLVAQGDFNLTAGEYLPLSASISYYTVSFTESNLPSNTIWYVNLSNGQSFSSSTNVISFTEPDGTYSYTIATTNKIYSPSPFSGSFTVNGKSVSESVIFSLVKYNITFTETGLPSGTSWILVFDNHSYTLTNTSYVFSLTNGTYSYSATSKDYKNISGTFTVSGSSKSISLTFTLQTYNITFTETGLPSGTSWTLDFNGNTHSLTNTSYTFKLTNGTYSYSATSKDYKNISGSVTVNGASKTVDLSFILQTYTVTFTETGLPSGTAWYVILNNINESSNTNTIIFSIQNGTYAYKIGNIPGYSVSSGSIVVNGNNISKTITYTKNAVSGINIGEYIIAGIIIIAVIGAIIVLIRKRK
ncbi:thermopsin [Picrophilus oshimae]|uniref:thermopsin n=1 Tax=Picrophilus oshimae TaxID=46632 RepID=UPI001379D1F1|nr:thermopsin [Picrophilus oshimae]